MIIDICNDDEFLRQHILKRAQSYYKPLPRCSMGFTMMMCMTEKQKEQAMEQDKKWVDAIKVINDLFGDKK